MAHNPHAKCLLTLQVLQLFHRTGLSKVDDGLLPNFTHFLEARTLHGWGGGIKWRYDIKALRGHLVDLVSLLGVREAGGYHHPFDILGLDALFPEDIDAEGRPNHLRKPIIAESVKRRLPISKGDIAVMEDPLARTDFTDGPLS